MRITRQRLNPGNWLLPLTLLAFIGPSIKYLSSILTLNTRWLFLGLLSIQMLFSLRKNRPNGTLFILCLSYIIWCYCTYLWSEVPSLSIMKTSALALVMFTMILAGQWWVLQHGTERVFNGVSLFVLASLLATFLGYQSETAYDVAGENIKLYQGFVGSPNMLGSLLAISSAFIVWKLYLNWNIKKKRFFWASALFGAILFLGLSQSRASLLIGVSIMGGFLFSFRMKRILPLLFVFLFLSLLVYAFAPEFQAKAKERVIYKYASETQGIFYTRQQPWADSLEKAIEGGFIGAGYGVTIGAPSVETGALTSIGYGREKGNTQLAIVEETGVIGLVLYILMVGAIGRHIFMAFAIAKDPKLKVALGIILGVYVGMFLQSIFEAWWVAPGSPESVAFWVFVGLGLGLAKLVTQENRTFTLQQRIPPNAFSQSNRHNHISRHSSRMQSS